MPRKDGKDRGIFEKPPGSGKWYACWKEGGKVIKKLVGSKELAKAYYIKMKAAAQEAELFPERVRSRNRLTVAQLVEKYQPEWQTKTTAEKDDFFAVWWCKRIGQRAAALITTADIAAARAEKQKERSAATANRYTSFIKRLFNLAIRDGILSTNPASGRVLPKLKEQTSIKYVEEQSESPLLAVCYPRLQRAVIVAICTGMRASEQFGMRRDQINWGSRTITLTETKSKETRYLAMSQRVEDVLREQLSTHSSEFVWPGRHGGRPNASALSRSLQRALKKAGLPVMSWHSLRHSFGTWAVARGADLRSLQEAMGHESLLTTEIYTQVMASRVKSVMDLVAGNPKAEPETQCPSSEPE